jgi:site-specific DNA-cytosine methylase
MDDLVGCTTAAFDVLSQQHTVAPDCYIYIAGWECDNYSGLNIHSAGGPGSLAANRGSSGISGNASLAYIRDKKPPLVILENVKNAAVKSDTGTSDHDKICFELNQAGYHVESAVLDAKDSVVGYGAMLVRWSCAPHGPTLSRIKQISICSRPQSNNSKHILSIICN